MENIFKQIGHIRALPNKAGYIQLAENILEQQIAGGGSGTEVLMRICGRLLCIKERYADAYFVIETEADGLIKYCRSIGLHPFTGYPE